MLNTPIFSGLHGLHQIFAQGKFIPITQPPLWFQFTMFCLMVTMYLYNVIIPMKAIFGLWQFLHEIILWHIHPWLLTNHNKSSPWIIMNHYGCFFLHHIYIYVCVYVNIDIIYILYIYVCVCACVYIHIYLYIIIHMCVCQCVSHYLNPSSRLAKSVVAY